MNDKTMRDLLLRMQAYERGSIHHRQGVLTTASPLAVALGASTVSYTGVQSLVGGLLVGDVVSCLVFGHDMIVLGKIGGIAPTPSPYVEFGPYQTSVTGIIAPNTDVAVGVTHNLGLTSTQQTNLTLLNGQSVDGSFAALMGTPRVDSQTANTITFKIGNPSGVNITAGFRFWMRTTP